MTDAPVPSWQECLDAGMTCTQAAAARGRTVKSGWNWAKRHGVKFAPVDRAEVNRIAGKCPIRRAKISETQRRPDVIKRRLETLAAYWRAKRAEKSLPDPADLRPTQIKWRLLATMTDAERANFRTFRASRYPTKEALTLAGRADLVEQWPD